MIERVNDRFGLETKKLIGDTAYGKAEFLAWMVNEANIEPHVPVWDKSAEKPGQFHRADFDYDKETDNYTGPNGKQLFRARRNYKVPRPIRKNGFLCYRASKMDCGACPLKEQCCQRRVLTRRDGSKLKAHGEIPCHRSAYCTRITHVSSKKDRMNALNNE